MRVSTPPAAFTLGLTTLLAIVPSVHTQQYAGSNITNSLAAVAGAEVSFFKVNDALGSTTLINYFSAPGGVRQDPTKVQRAVIALHGAGRDACKIFLVLSHLMCLVNADDRFVAK